MAVPMEEVQQFERGRRRLLLWYLPGVVALCGSQIAFYSLPEMSAGTRRMMALAVLVLFGGAMVKLSLWILRLYRRNEADRKQLMGALNDERIEHNRLLAWRDSFWAILIVTTALGIPGATYPHWIHPTAMSSLILMVACLSFAGSFLWRERE
jgi:hypothetical protein